MICVEDCIAIEVQNLTKHLEKFEEPMLKAVVREQVLKEHRPDHRKNAVKLGFYYELT